MNFKFLISKNINIYQEYDLQNLIIDSISADKGDFCLPCFTLSKQLKLNPNIIANNIKDNTTTNDIVEKCEVVGGYVNFFLNKVAVAKMLIEGFNVGNFSKDIGNNKTVLIDYCSPNMAKFLHIGHLKSLIIGESLARLFTAFGYNVKRLNFIGDFGTPFGKIIGGLLKWGSKEEIEEKGNDALQNYYVKFNQMEEQDESYSQYARDLFKKIEDKDAEIYPIYEKVIDIGLKDAKIMFNLLGVEFDDYRGEMYYFKKSDKMLKTLADKNLLTDSQGAKIVDLSPYDLTPAVIVKNDGTSLYITRDLAAAIERQKEYNFDKLLYVTDVAQVLHFKQLFKILELIGLKNSQGLEHVSYGRFSLPEGKISSRRGKQAVLVDLIDYAKVKADEIIKDRKFTIENPADVSNKVVKAVLNYNVLKVEKNKDCVFDVEKAFSFEGETAPYMQYTFTRLESILRKYEPVDVIADYSGLNDDAFEIIKMINDFGTTLELSLEKRDPSLICKRVMELCKMFNKFYTNCKILDENPATTKAKVELVKILKDTLAYGFDLICIDSLKEM